MGTDSTKEGEGHQFPTSGKRELIAMVVNTFFVLFFMADAAKHVCMRHPAFCIFKMHVQTLFCLMLRVVWYALLQLFKLFGVFVV
jgi:hypothetical protein